MQYQRAEEIGVKMISKSSSYLLVILFLTCVGNAVGQVARVKSEQQQQGPLLFGSEALVAHEPFLLISFS
jgi:hypothetical protein